MSCGGPGALVSGLRGTVLSFLFLKPVAQRFSLLLLQECAHRKDERLDLKKDEELSNISPSLGARELHFLDTGVKMS